MPSVSQQRGDVYLGLLGEQRHCVGEGLMVQTAGVSAQNFEPDIPPGNSGTG